MTQEWYGIVGRNGSGKSTVCDYLVSKSFSVFSLSDVVRSYAKKKGINQDRNSLTTLANQLKNEHGKHYFATQVFEQAKGKSKVVFDSIRHPSELNYLKSKGVYFIGVHAPLMDCYQRIIKRSKSTDHVTFEEFKRQDEYEMTGKSSGQWIQDCLLLCNSTIENTAGLPALYGHIDSILKQMKVSNAQ